MNYKYKIVQRTKPKTDDFGPAGRVEYHIVSRETGALVDIELSWGKAYASMLTYERNCK